MTGRPIIKATSAASNSADTSKFDGLVHEGAGLRYLTSF